MNEKVNFFIFENYCFLFVFLLFIYRVFSDRVVVGLECRLLM